jgi:hypothetical protein
MPVRFTSLRLCLATAALAGLGLAPLVVRADTPPANTYTAYKVNLSVGEPSIGFDPNAHAAMYGAGTATERLTWDAGGTMTQTVVTAPTAATSLDAITFVDPVTHRTFNSQLAGACSLLAYSDDAGANWTPSSGCGINTLLDHQSVGGGPYHAPLDAVPNPIYPHAVYYCAQNGFNATCARSDDGGLTFGPGATISNGLGNNGTDPLGGSCSGLHGHLRVSGDGTVYVPLKGCGGTPSVNNLTNEEYVGGHPTLSTSTDNGVTYTLHMVMAGNNSDESDPSVATTPDNTVYFGWEDGVNPDDSHNGTTSSARIAVSRDHGQTWTPPVDLSTPLGLHNVQFPEVIAGDNGRAAMAFLGTTGIGDDQTNAFKGAVWHLYVSTTYDGGATWTTVDATPGDPVQRGCIDMQGIAPGSPRTDVCSQRNLLDFNDITMDAQGRVLVAYADGCIAACVTDASKPSTSHQDMVLRQTSGRGLLAASDSLLAPPSGAAGQASPAAQSAAAVVSTLPNTSATGIGAAAWLPLLALPGGVVVARVLRRRRGEGRTGG